jgi:hypothetical protein
VTATLQLLDVLIVSEHHTRRIVHCNVTTNPLVEWTRQQLRNAIPVDHGYKFDATMQALKIVTIYRDL